ncbi:MAG: hypothetical protein Q7V02_07125 [Methylophilus sp.]|nr:hypothetical protein [Methylophilus sp.]
MTKILLIATSIFLLSGCVSVKYNGSKTTTTPIDRPEIGVIVVASIGDPLIEKGLIVEENILEVYEKMGGFNYTIPALKYPQIGFDEKNDFYAANGVTKNPLSDPFDALSVSKDSNNELCVITNFGSPVCYQGNFKRTTKISERGTSFQQTLLYSGRVGDKLKISYREFSNSTARPAFNNDVEYDYSTSKTIAYKGAMLEVLSADNTSITYKVIRNFK